MNKTLCDVQTFRGMTGEWSTVSISYSHTRSRMT